MDFKLLCFCCKVSQDFKYVIGFVLSYMVLEINTSEMWRIYVKHPVHNNGSVEPYRVKIGVLQSIS
jgi:hypothetical protein